MITANDVARLLGFASKDTIIMDDEWIPQEHNPIQVIGAQIGPGTIGYLKRLSNTALMLAPLTPTEEIKEETELLAVDVLIPLSKVDIIDRKSVV